MDAVVQDHKQFGVLGSMAYSEAIATGQHFRLPEWAPGRTVVAGADGLRVYQDGKYTGYIGQLSMDEQKKTTFSVCLA